MFLYMLNIKTYLMMINSNCYLHYQHHFLLLYMYHFLNHIEKLLFFLDGLADELFFVHVGSLLYIVYCMYSVEKQNRWTGLQHQLQTKAAFSGFKLADSATMFFAEGRDGLRTEAVSLL